MSKMLTTAVTVGVRCSGELYMKMNNLEQAEHWYREALKSKPDHIPAHLTLAKLFQHKVHNRWTSTKRNTHTHAHTHARTHTHAHTHTHTHTHMHTHTHTH